MTFLPIVGRELTVTARRPATYWLRFWAAMVVLAIWLFLLATARRTTPAQLGQVLLNALGILALGFSMLAGAFLTADSLAEEKREGTLGLLFLTDLRSHDVVLGKLAACSLHAFFGLLATFPILGLTLLLGGVTGPEFARLVLVFTVTLFFSLGIGMFASAISHESRQAMIRALLLIVAFAGIFPAFWWAVTLALTLASGGQWGANDLPPHLLLPSPVYAYLEALDVRYQSAVGARHFWASVATLFALGAAGVAMACVTLPRMWRRVEGRAASPRRKSGLLSGAMSAARRRRLLQPNPCYWLAVRESPVRRATFWTLGVLVAVWALFYATLVAGDPTGKLFEPEVPFLIGLIIAFAMHAVLKVFIAVEASRRLHQDRWSGALEILLATPVSVPAILNGQRRALWQNFRWPLAVLCLVNLAMLWAVFCVPQLHMGTSDQFLFSELFLGGIFVLFMDFRALLWVGMWRGLVARHHARAVVGTAGRVLGAGWLSIFLVMMVRPAFRGPGGIGVMFAAWFIIGAGLDAALSVIAHHRLRVEFRRVAAEGSRGVALF